MDQHSGRTLSERITSGLSFSSGLELLKNRTEGNALGVVRFDRMMLDYRLPSEFGMVLPNAVQENAITRLRIMGLGESTYVAKKTFDAPSNVMFIPAEYGAVNCCSPCDPCGEYYCKSKPLNYHCPPCYPGGGEEPQVTISGSESGEDIANVSWTATATGGTVLSYQWDFQFPQGSGNVPNVDIMPQGQSMVNLTAKWFAYPADECGAANESTYTILLFVEFQGGTEIQQEKPLQVTLPWSRLGQTGVRFSGSPTIGFDAQRNLWVVTGTGTLKREVVSDILIPSSSQFRNKAEEHEEVHVTQYETGLMSELFKVEDFFNLIKDLTGTSQAELESKIDQAFDEWITDQGAEELLKLNQAEREAYAVSDQIDPKFVYQNCGQY
jgi:hypothetical protein